MDKLEALKKDVACNLSYALKIANCDPKATDYEKTLAHGEQNALSHVLDLINLYQELERTEKGETK